MMGSVQIKGLDMLDEKIAKLTNDKTKDKVLSRALNAALNPIRKDAKRYAAVAPEPHIMVLRSGRKVVVQRGLLRSAIRKRKVPKREMGELGGYGVAMGIYVGKGTKPCAWARPSCAWRWSMARPPMGRRSARAMCAPTR